MGYLRFPGLLNVVRPAVALLVQLRSTRPERDLGIVIQEIKPRLRCELQGKLHQPLLKHAAVMNFLQPLHLDHQPQGTATLRNFDELLIDLLRYVGLAACLQLTELQQHSHNVQNVHQEARWPMQHSGCRRAADLQEGFAWGGGIQICDLPEKRLQYVRAEALADTVHQPAPNMQRTRPREVSQQIQTLLAAAPVRCIGFPSQLADHYLGQLDVLLQVKAYLGFIVFPSLGGIMLVGELGWNEVAIVVLLDVQLLLFVRWCVRDRTVLRLNRTWMRPLLQQCRVRVSFLI